MVFELKNFFFCSHNDSPPSFNKSLETPLIYSECRSSEGTLTNPCKGLMLIRHRDGGEKYNTMSMYTFL